MYYPQNINGLNIHKLFFILVPEDLALERNKISYVGDENKERDRVFLNVLWHVDI
jgi:hypothetical protein